MGLLDDQLARMSHNDLYLMRGKMPGSQEYLAPFEHRAFAREFATESPFTAGVSLPFAIPAYSLYKALGFGNARSPASLEEIKQGYIGLAEGLLGR